MFDHSQPIGLYPFAKTSSWLTADLVVNEKGIFVNGRGLEIEIFPKVVDENFFVLFLDFVKAKTPTYSVFEKVILELKNDETLNKINLSLERKIKVWKISFFETIVSEFNKEKDFKKAVESSLEQWGVKTPVLATRVVEKPQAVVEEIPKAEEPAQSPDSSETTNPNVVTDITPKEVKDSFKAGDKLSKREREIAGTMALEVFLIGNIIEDDIETFKNKGGFVGKLISKLLDGEELPQEVIENELFVFGMSLFESFRAIMVKHSLLNNTEEDHKCLREKLITPYTEELILIAASKKSASQKVEEERPQDPVVNNTSPLAKEMKTAVKAAAGNWSKAPPKFPTTLISMGTAWGWDDLPYSIRMLEAEDPANAKLVRMFFEEHDFNEILLRHGAKTLKKKEVKSLQDAVMHNRRR